MSASNTYNSNDKKISVEQYEKETDSVHTDLNDEEVVEKALDEVGDDFAKIWKGNLEPVDGDQEAAEKALIEILLYYTTREVNQIERLVKQSDLMSDTWNDDGGKFKNKTAQLAHTLTDYDRSVYPDDEPPEILSSDERDKKEYESDIGRVPPDLNVVRHDGKYQTVRFIDEQTKDYDEVANFTLDVNSFLKSDDGSVKIDMDVVPASPFEDTYTVIVDSTAFNDPSAFREEVCKGKTVTYKGSSRELADIKQRVGHQEAPDRVGVDTVGLHEGEMVTPSGVFNDEWVVEDPTHNFEPKEQAIENKWALPVEGDGDYDEEEVANIVRALWKTRDSERFLPILGYWYASLLSPKIREIEDELPLATVMADTGAGKTSTLGVLYKLIGMDGNPYSARDTKYALLNALASTNNIPIWLDEYKPSDMRSYEVDALQDFLRKTTRRGDETRGNADQTVTTYTLESPVVLTGEESIQGAAEERRSIRTQFRSAVTEEKSEYARYWAQLNGGSYQDENGVNYCDGYDLQEHAKAIWQFILGVEGFETRWRTAKEHVYDILEREGIVGISDLELTALTMIRVGVELYTEFGVEHGVEESDLPTDVDINEAVIYIAHKMGQSNRTSHVGEFVGLVANAIESGHLKRADHYDDNTGEYIIKNENKGNEKLLIKLDKVYPLISKYISDHDLGGIDLLDNTNDYKKRMKEDVPYIDDISRPTSELGRCVSIQTHKAENEVDGFERGKVNPDAYNTYSDE